SRIVAARCTTLSTPRTAWRRAFGSPRSPSVMCTRIRFGPSRRGSRTRQRTSWSLAIRRGRRALPTRPLAPVSRVSPAELVTMGAYALHVSELQEYAPAKQTSNSERAKPKQMAYVIAEPCIGTKDNSCVEVCPVDCIHPTPDEPDYEAAEMLYIDPEE